MIMKYILITLILFLISINGFSQRKYIELQEVRSEILLPKSSFLIANKCPFKINFKITHQGEKETFENLESEENGLFWVDNSCRVTIIREEDKPGIGDTYSTLEGRKYGFEYDSNTDMISLIEYTDK